MASARHRGRWIKATAHEHRCLCRLACLGELSECAIKSALAGPNERRGHKARGEFLFHRVEGSGVRLATRGGTRARLAHGGGRALAASRHSALPPVQRDRAAAWALLLRGFVGQGPAAASEAKHTRHLPGLLLRVALERSPGR